VRLERWEQGERHRGPAACRVRREVQGAISTEALEEPAGLREELEPEESFRRAERLEQAERSEAEGLSERAVLSGQGA